MAPDSARTARLLDWLFGDRIFGRNPCERLETLSELVFPVGTHCRRVWVHLRAKVTQRHQRFGLAGVLEADARPRAVLGAEVFVLGQFVETDEFRAVQRLAIDPAGALHTE